MVICPREVGTSVGTKGVGVAVFVSWNAGVKIGGMNVDPGVRVSVKAGVNVEPAGMQLDNATAVTKRRHKHGMGFILVSPCYISISCISIRNHSNMPGGNADH